MFFKSFIRGFENSLLNHLISKNGLPLDEYDNLKKEIKIKDDQLENSGMLLEVMRMDNSELRESLNLAHVANSKSIRGLLAENKDLRNQLIDEKDKRIESLEFQLQQVTALNVGNNNQLGYTPGNFFSDSLSNVESFITNPHFIMVYKYDRSSMTIPFDIESYRTFLSNVLNFDRNNITVSSSSGFSLIIRNGFNDVMDVKSYVTDRNPVDVAHLRRIAKYLS